MASLTLLQGYSSNEDEEEEEKYKASPFTDDDEESNEDEDGEKFFHSRRYRPPQHPPPNSSILPSALDAFAEIAGPPEFLNNAVGYGEKRDEMKEVDLRGRNRARRDKKDLPAENLSVSSWGRQLVIEEYGKSPCPNSFPWLGIQHCWLRKGWCSRQPVATLFKSCMLPCFIAAPMLMIKGAIVESKAQLVGIRDRVRSDVEGSAPAPSIAKTTGEGKRVVSASNPEAKDAADLLRMCLQCGVPKTYSHIRGMVCPICGDRPPADPLKEPEKKKGSTIKDKEKSKRMKGQSSHASWKSETEMQLRQQFD